MSQVQVFALGEKVMSAPLPSSRMSRPRMSSPHSSLLVGETYSSAIVRPVRLMRVKSSRSFCRPGRADTDERDKERMSAARRPTVRFMS
jgi:hypothetical protein